MLSLVRKQRWDILSSDVLNSSAIYFPIMDSKHAFSLHQFMGKSSILAQEYKMGHGIELTELEENRTPILLQPKNEKKKKE